MNKSFLTNLIAFVILVLGLVLGVDELKIVGLFALSGAVTNWLAVHMLFERVPFLYGSGVIVNRFEEFKAAILALIMKEFFTKENLTRFFEDELNSKDSKFDFESLLQKTDFSPAFESLKEAVMQSSFGGMLGMFGGEQALEPLKEPFTDKLQKAMIDITSSDSFKETLHKNLGNSDVTEEIYEKVEAIVIARLNELTPNMVKEIVQKMIKEHLGWLVVWGGVFGGVIGLISSYFI